MTSRNRILIAVTVVAFLCGAGVRFNVLQWEDPWTPHHPDEIVLPLEAVAMWEGVTPREVGWPASTTRLMLSGWAAVLWVSEQGQTAWSLRANPQAVLHNVSQWVGDRYLDPAPLYRAGRTISLLTGLIHLALIAWVAYRWTGAVSIPWALLAAALSPVVVTHSQYVLADIQGLAFATAVVGLAAAPTPKRILGMAALAGLAAASKFHFGIYLLTPLVCLYGLPSESRSRRVGLALGALAIFGGVLLALVPWFVINPVLGAKEFANVALSKITADAVVKGGAWAVFTLLFSAMGVLTWAGATIGAAYAVREWRRYLPIAVPLSLGVLALTGSGVVFDRYALVLVPAVAVLAGLGWSRLLGREGGTARLLAGAVLVAAIAATSVHLMTTSRVAGERDVDIAAAEWVLANVPRGTGVAVYDETVALLPRTRQQLGACLSRLSEPDAYSRKAQLIGLEASAGSSAMTTAILNDELFYQFWCRRELEASQDVGYNQLLFNGSPRFWSVSESDAIRAFQDGTPTGGTTVDVLILNREDSSIPGPPAHIVQNRRGQRAIYVRALSLSPSTR